MRWKEINQLFESLDQTIMLSAYKQCRMEMRKFIDEEFNTYIKLLQGDDDILSHIGKLEKELSDVEDFGKEYDRISDILSDLRSEFSSRDIQVSKKEKNDIINSFLQKIELTLQDLATNEIEEKYGKIDRYGDIKNQDFERIMNNNNLYYLQHIIVQIELNGEKYGKPQTSGAYFQPMVSSSGNWTTPYASTIDFSNQLSSGIKIFASKDEIWNVLLDEFKKKLDIDLFGESMDYQRLADIFFKKILSNFVHEFVHLLQYVEKSNQVKIDRKEGKEKRFSNGTGMSYVTNKNRGKRQVYNKEKRKYEYVKAGKRGGPDYLTGRDGVPTEERYENYFGTSHEIEAHAAGAAADMVAEFLNDRENGYNRYSLSKYNQSDLNDAIDDILVSLKLGYLDSSPSLRNYQQFIRDKIETVDKKIDNVLPKADILHRKAWRIFMTKLVKALQAFKKPVPKDDYL